MSKREEQFVRLIGGADVNAEPNAEHRERLREQMLSEFRDACDANKTSISTWPSRRTIGHKVNTVNAIWRTLMSSRVSRYATVTAVAAVVVLGLTFISLDNNNNGKVWAIEQTIAALKNVRTAYLKGSVNMTNRKVYGIPEGQVQPAIVEAWGISHNGLNDDEARINLYWQAESVVEQNGEVYPCGDERTSITIKCTDAVYYYDSCGHSVYINDPQSCRVMYPVWPGPEYLQQLKSWCSKWHEEYGKDEITSRDSVFVRYAISKWPYDGSYWIQYDLESKLPVRAKAWENQDWEGEPRGNVEQIVYNLDIPDDLLHATISAESLHVTDYRKATPDEEKTFTIEVPEGTCKFPEIVENALKERAEQESTTQAE